MGGCLVVDLGDLVGGVVGAGLCGNEVGNLFYGGAPVACGIVGPLLRKRRTRRLRPIRVKLSMYWLVPLGLSGFYSPFLRNVDRD